MGISHIWKSTPSTEVAGFQKNWIRSIRGPSLILSSDFPVS